MISATRAFLFFVVWKWSELLSSISQSHFFPCKDSYFKNSVCVCVCMNVLCAYIFMQHVYVSGACRGQKRALGPLELSYRQLWPITWVLETEPGSSERAANACNSSVISPALTKTPVRKTQTHVASSSSPSSCNLRRTRSWIVSVLELKTIWTKNDLKFAKIVCKVRNLVSWTNGSWQVQAQLTVGPDVEMVCFNLQYASIGSHEMCAEEEKEG